VWLPSGRSAAPWAAVVQCRWRRSQWDAAGQLTIRGAWGEESGNQPLARADASRSVTTLTEAEALGSHVADLLCAAGARRMAPDAAPAAA